MERGALAGGIECTKYNRTGDKSIYIHNFHANLPKIWLSLCILKDSHKKSLNRNIEQRLFYTVVDGYNWLLVDFVKFQL